MPTINQTDLYLLGLKLVWIPSNNRFARNIQILQVFFLQDLQDLAQNLAILALRSLTCKMQKILQES